MMRPVRTSCAASRALTAASQESRRAQPPRPRNRRGATLVEFAVVAPVMLLLVLALFEFGRLMMVEQIITNAAREGARRGILEQTTAESTRSSPTIWPTPPSPRPR